MGSIPAEDNFSYTHSFYIKMNILNMELIIPFHSFYIISYKTNDWNESGISFHFHSFYIKSLKSQWNEFHSNPFVLYQMAENWLI